MSSQKIVIKAESREATKRALRDARVSEKVPGVIFRKEGNLNVAIPQRNLPKGLTGTQILAIEVDGKSVEVIMREVQVDRLTNQPIHMDFQEVKANDTISALVRLDFVGITKEQEKDCAFRPVKRTVKFKGQVSAFPEKLSVNISQMQPDQTLHLDDSMIPNGLRLHGRARPAIAQLVRK
jgi:large subunit ribosomal protein L25